MNKRLILTGLVPILLGTSKADTDSMKLVKAMQEHGVTRDGASYAFLQDVHYEDEDGGVLAFEDCFLKYQNNDLTVSCVDNERLGESIDGSLVVFGAWDEGTDNQLEEIGSDNGYITKDDWSNISSTLIKRLEKGTDSYFGLMLGQGRTEMECEKGEERFVLNYNDNDGTMLDVYRAGERIDRFDPDHKDLAGQRLIYTVMFRDACGDL